MPRTASEHRDPHRPTDKDRLRQEQRSQAGDQGQRRERHLAPRGLGENGRQHVVLSLREAVARRHHQPRRQRLADNQRDQQIERDS
jgi:hypothetical protein